MLVLRSPAKINLFLKVVNRRLDGYHNLASLFQVIGLSDRIHISISSDNRVDQLTCTDPTIPIDHSNLILKAANLFRSKTGLTFSVKAHLEKHIPHQAGFGGGSSNAATTLWALNQLCGVPVATPELMHWSADIGSDIPFFFSEGTAYCTGRGEIVRELPAPKQTNLWLVKPKQGLSTPAVFKKLDFKNLSIRNPEDSLESYLQGNPDYFNDLEEPAFAAMPELANLKLSLLSAGFDTVLMTGTGSGFFCLGEATPPCESNLFCTPSNFLNRSANSWYI